MIVKCSGGTKKRLADLEERQKALQIEITQKQITSSINRVVEDVNHRFTFKVLTRDFISHDLGISARNLRNDRQNSNDILDRVDKKEFTERLKNLLEIRNAK